MIKVYCDACGKGVDKSERSDGFGALSIIKKEYLFDKNKMKNQEFKQQDFDLCSDCCTKIFNVIEEIQKAEKSESK